MKNLTRLSFIATILAATAQLASANIVVNGDFSSNASDFAYPDNYLGQSGNPSVIPGFDVTDLNGGITGYSSGHNDGNFTPTGYTSTNPLDGADGTFLFLQNTATDGTESRVTQGLTLTADTIYSLSFDYAARNGQEATGVISISDGGTLIGGYDNSVDGLDGDDFTAFTTTFTTGADVSNALLTVSKVAEDGDHTFDVTNLNITAIGTVVTPEPGTFALMGLGILLLVVTLRNRRSKNV
jgi:hypothetical protein